MNKERELIKQLKQLVVERERTIKENKKDMHSFLNQYKEALELEKELLRECKNLRRVINHLREAETAKRKLKNSASNRDMDIVNSDEQ